MAQWLGTGSFNRWQRLVEFEEGHAEEIGDFARTAVAEFFVEVHGTFERRRGVQRDAGAILPAKFGFGVGQQLGSKSRALTGGEDRHASEVAFVLADGLAGDGADDLAGRSLGDENLHVGETVLECFWSEHGIEISGGGVGVTIRCEGGPEAGEDFGSVIVSGTADGNCGG